MAKKPKHTDIPIIYNYNDVRNHIERAVRNWFDEDFVRHCFLTYDNYMTRGDIAYYFDHTFKEMVWGLLSQIEYEEEQREGEE